MAVADSERDLELQKRKLGKEKEGLICKIMMVVFAR